MKLEAEQTPDKTIEADEIGVYIEIYGSKSLPNALWTFLFRQIFLKLK